MTTTSSPRQSSLYNFRNVFQSSGQPAASSQQLVLTIFKCFPLPMAFFVITSDSSKPMRSAKSEVSRWHGIITCLSVPPEQGGMLPLCSPRCTIALQRVPFRLKSEQVPKVGLLKSKEMIKSKPG